MGSVRKATKDDISIIAEFQLNMALETENLELNSKTVLQGVEAVIKDPNKGFYLLADVDGKVVGCTLLTPEWSDWRNRCFLWIQSLYVLPQFRKKGIFKKLYQTTQQIVHTSEHYAGIKLYVDQHNQKAQDVYEKVGMQKSHYQLYEWVK